MKIRNWSLGRASFIAVTRSGITPSFGDHEGYRYDVNFYPADRASMEDAKHLRLRMNHDEAERLHRDLGEALKWKSEMEGRATAPRTKIEDIVVALKRVELYSNWCYVDRLDDKDLQAGELLRVELPDGAMIDGPVIIESKDEPYQDMGHPTTIPYRTAFLAIEYHGATLRLPLRGLLAERGLWSSGKRGGVL